MLPQAVESAICLALLCICFTLSQFLLIGIKNHSVVQVIRVKDMGLCYTHTHPVLFTTLANTFLDIVQVV